MMIKKFSVIIYRDCLTNCCYVWTFKVELLIAIHLVLILNTTNNLSDPGGNFVHSYPA
jgi:hypothetical protein